MDFAKIIINNILNGYEKTVVDEHGNHTKEKQPASLDIICKEIGKEIALDSAARKELLNKIEPEGREIAEAFTKSFNWGYLTEEIKSKMTTAINEYFYDNRERVIEDLVKNAIKTYKFSDLSAGMRNLLHEAMDGQLNFKRNLYKNIDPLIENVINELKEEKIKITRIDGWENEVEAFSEVAKILKKILISKND